MTGDLLPAIVGIALVALAAAFVLLPFARGARVEGVPPESPTSGRFGIYRQVLDLEFDYQMGKLSMADFEQLSSELLTQAGAELRAERGNLGEIDREIEQEIAAARAAFAAARRASRTPRAEPVP